MAKAKNDKTRFTHVDHTIREKYDLTMNQYAIADSIAKLQRLNANGLCYASKDYLGSFINISRRATINVINKLVEKRLVVRTSEGLRTTAKWNRNFEKSENGINYESE